MNASETQPQWTPVALSTGLAAGGVMRVETAGQDLAVWRGNDNRVHCVHNRCPHRGMRLSFGFVRGNRLNCLYHGWQYSASGACAHIPAHPDLTPPATLCAKIHPCQEHAGLIWVSVSDDPPKLAAEDHTTPRQPLRSIEMPVNAGDMLAALQQAPLPNRDDPRHGCEARLLFASPLHCEVTLTLTPGSVVTLRLAIQPATDTRCWLHAQLRDNASPETCVTASRWLDTLRETLEATA